MELLAATGIDKAYPGVLALEDVSFDLRAGEVHGLVGENGAGKSTLIKILTGAEQPDRGRIVLRGRDLGRYGPREARQAGLVAIYQQPALFPHLSVAENLALGLEPGALWRRVDPAARRRRARALLARVGADIDPDRRVLRLSMPEQQLVELARAVGAEASVLIMDEPTACLAEQEVERLFALVRDLRAGGVGIVYITHRLAELFALADRVSVLRDGRNVATHVIGEVSERELIREMVGRELAGTFPQTGVSPGEEVLVVEGLGCRATGLRDVSFTVRAGEILGVGGLMGSGRSELARTLFGLTPADRGEIRIRGEVVSVTSPAVALAHGIAYVPEDRRRFAILADLAVLANTTLAVLPRLARRGLVDARAEVALAGRLLRDLDVRTPSLFTRAGTLSGGNQQKVSLARWLATEPRIVIVDEPTQGIDVGAKSEVHRILVELACRGAAVLLISSELPELLGLSDRVLVMRDGRPAAELERAEATAEQVLALALGHGGAEVMP